MTKDVVRVGCGAGFANDRLDAGVTLVEHGDLDWLVLECLAERTTALGQRRERSAPGTGFDPSAESRIRSLLEPLTRTRTRMIANFGSANPLAAGRLVRRVAAELGIDVRVAVVTGDDVLEHLTPDTRVWEGDTLLSDYGVPLSANAYLGIDAVLPAIESEADFIVTGRVADPSLFLAPMVAELGWDLDDHDLLAAGTLAAHLLECGSQSTGGYFVDPPYKTVDDLAFVGFPLAEVERDGGVTITKVSGTGGAVTFDTVAEQLTYEILDPASYITPDVVVDIREVRLDEVGADRVRVSGARGRPRPDSLKVSVGYLRGHLVEAQIGYAGPGCVERAEAAAEVLRRRLPADVQDLRLDVVGVSSMAIASPRSTPDECLVRLAGVCGTAEAARHAGEELVGLYNNGPAGGGGARSHVSEHLGILSTTLDRSRITTRVHLVEA